MAETLTLRQAAPVRWAKVVDHTRCIGCHACSTACKAENGVPLGVHRTYVKSVDVGRFPQVRRAFQVTRCNQCDEPPCVFACPTGAMAQRPDGIVDFDKRVCIGCKACIAACPYDAIFINPQDGAAEKCNFCAHRLDVGLEPACVAACPTEAIFVGDLNDGTSRVAEAVGRDVVAVRRPQKETLPKLFYKGAHQATLDPIAARRPPGGIFQSSEQGNMPRRLVSGHPVTPNYAMPAILAYDVPRRTAWGWPVSLYAWTNAVAAGGWLVPALLLLAGALVPGSPLWAGATPLLAGVFLAASGAVLVAGIDHPDRLLRAWGRLQWRSWLARGVLIVAAYGAILSLHFLAGWLEAGAAARRAALNVAFFLGLPIAALAAVYPAWLFAQARARELWQSPLLPPQLLIQAVLAGSSALVPIAAFVEAEAVGALAGVAAGATLLHLLLIGSQATMGRVTAHTRLATREMTSGRYGHSFWLGVALQGLGAAALLFAPGPLGAVLVLAGLLAFDHALLQAGQSVPLA
jgi:Fe-S-cluster-containing dehydrogenase component